MFPWSGRDPASKNEGETSILLSTRSSTIPAPLSPVTTRASEKHSLVPPKRFAGSGEQSPSEEAKVTITRDETPHDQAVRNLGIGAFASPRQAPASQFPEGSKLPQDVPVPSTSRTDAQQGTGQTQNHTPSSLSNPIFPPGPEDLFDPATGAFIGVMHTPSPSNGDTTQTTAELSVPKRIPRVDSDSVAMPEHAENMWAQLSKIRTLQGDIARMHLTLDGSGIVDGIKDRRGTAGKTAEGRSRSASDVASLPEDEFTKRKESIAQILDKLDSLSEAVTAFHSIPTPQLHFPPPSTATHSRAGSLSPSISLAPDTFPLLSPLVVPLSGTTSDSNNTSQKPSYLPPPVPQPKYASSPSPPPHNTRLDSPSHTAHPPRLRRLETLYEPMGNVLEESVLTPPTAPFGADSTIGNSLLGIGSAHHDSPVSMTSSLKYDNYGRPFDGAKGSDSGR